VGANLVGANLADANLVGANLVGVNLADVNLADVNLVGANLDGANLAGANLVGANLAGFRLRNGQIRQVSGGRYGVATALTESGRILQFGCVALTLPDWRVRLADLCRRHEPNRVDQYVSEIGALLDWCDTFAAQDAAAKDVKP
jgi:uncharacterized protein YjbI with pentapeptide repeats